MPNVLDFQLYFQQERAINASIYSIQALLDQSKNIELINYTQSGFELKLETLERAYQVSRVLSNKISESLINLKRRLKKITDEE
ncbi:hypothetical protein [Abyssogena phaseoliformis symbiont]|uniref:hypothetical protein n=1 Tax=Abyssogena phaseoliformis symbiont TaxID=596095 RepID=UPI0019166754|nr:hypothetical protein [Abyssogena phaseoliformis symbiont]MBW5288868.1 hypothetical protein [Candidatus Ruthia sp. Apha_13_S6]